MIDALSSSERSVNNGTICGVVIWSMKNEKKPIRASVTAAIAAIRAAPSDFTKSKKPCTGFVLPALGAQHAPHSARFAQFKVSVRLMRRAGRQNNLCAPRNSRGPANKNAGREAGAYD